MVPELALRIPDGVYQFGDAQAVPLDPPTKLPAIVGCHDSIHAIVLALLLRDRLPDVRALEKGASAKPN